MSTNDVPGANPANADVLAMGCWAEHDDGSLIFVESVEAAKVVYSMFDVAVKPPVEYRHVMDEPQFKMYFTWKPGEVADAQGKPAAGRTQRTSGERWTWHDKTLFPWTRVLGDFPPGQRDVVAEHTLSAAERVAQSLNIRAEAIRDRYRTVAEAGEEPSFQKAALKIMEGIQEALASLKA